MVEIGPYLFKDHGTSLLKFFSLLEQEITRNTTCDLYTEEPILSTESNRREGHRRNF